MFRSIKKHHRRVLITIDEATNSKGVRIFASTYQMLLREQLPVFLLMTGLHHQIDRLRNAEGMTFLERAPRTVLSSLNFTAMVFRYRDALKTKGSVMEANGQWYIFYHRQTGNDVWWYTASRLQRSTIR